MIGEGPTYTDCGVPCESPPLRWYIDKRPASEKQVRDYVGLMLWSYLRKWSARHE